MMYQQVGLPSLGMLQHTAHRMAVPHRSCLQEGGWGIASFARAAELLKHTWPDWAASGVEGRFLSWVNQLVMPWLNHEMLHRLPLANWWVPISRERTGSGSSCCWGAHWQV